MDPVGEIGHLRYILRDLEVLRNEGTITQEGYDYLSKRYKDRLLRLKGIEESRVEKEAVTKRPPPSPPKPRKALSFEMFLAEHTISLFLYLGAFLVAMAALIYVGYSWETFSGLTKTFFIVLVTAVFLILGSSFSRNPKLKRAGFVFLGVASLLSPLDFLAAYKFVLSDSGLSSTSIWFIGALYCAIFYLLLGFRLPWKPYIYLSLTSLLSANYALYRLLGIQSHWYGVALLIFSYLLLIVGVSFIKANKKGLLGVPFVVFSYIVTLLSALLLILEMGKTPAAFAHFLPIGTFLIFNFYLIQAINRPIRELGFLSCFSFLMFVISFGYVTEVSVEYYGFILMASGLLFSAVAYLLKRRRLVISQDFDILSASLVFLAPFLMTSNPPLYAISLFTAAAYFPWLAYLYKKPEILYISGYFFSLGYSKFYELLGGAYLPSAYKAAFLLPIFLALSSMSLYARKRYRFNWILPLYVLSYLYALWISGLGVDHKLFEISCFIVFAVYTYLIARNENRSNLVSLSSIWVAVALWFTLDLLNIKGAFYPLFFSIFGVSLYLLRFSHWPQAYRYLGFIYATITPIFGSLQEGSFREFDIHALVLIISLAILAYLIYFDSEIEGSRDQKYVSSFVFLLSFLWLERFFNFTNMQAYIIPFGIHFIVLGSLLRIDSVLNVKRDEANILSGFGAVVLMLPTLIMRYGPDGWRYTLLLGFEGFAVLGYGISNRRRVLVVLGTSFVVMDVVSQLFDYLRALPSWVIIGTVGTLLLMIAVTLLYKRDNILRAREHIGEKWQNWD